MASQAFIKLSLSSRLVFGSLHFVANQLRDLSMQEPEPSEILGSGVDWVPLTLAQDGPTFAARLGHESNTARESEWGSSGNDVDHFGTRFLEASDPICGFMPISEHDSDNDCEVFMVGQGDTLGDQTEGEIVAAAAAKIARSEQLAKSMEKATGKRHASHDWGSELTGSDEDSGDGTTSGGHHPKYD
jgi:hypothetical protein